MNYSHRNYKTVRDSEKIACTIVVHIRPSLCTIIYFKPGVWSKISLSWLESESLIYLPAAGGVCKMNYEGAQFHVSEKEQEQMLTIEAGRVARVKVVNSEK